MQQERRQSNGSITAGRPPSVRADVFIIKIDIWALIVCGGLCLPSLRELKDWRTMSRGFSGGKIAVELDCKQSLFCSKTCKREYLSSEVARVASALVFAPSQLVPSQLARLRCSNTLKSKRETARNLRTSLFILDNRKGTTLFLKTITANYGWKWSFLLFWIQQRP